MESIAKRWTSTVLLADGAMGTLLFGRRAVASCVELFNVNAPDDVERAHREYIDAGAQVIESNTFAANRLKLRAHELADRLVEINAAGVAIARRAAAGRAYVAGSIGPLGALLRPLGAIDRAEARDIFAEHAAAVTSAKPDLLLLETFGNLDEALIAVEAARRSAPNLPLLVSLSVVEDGKTAGGDALLPAFARLRQAGADAVGINCAVGPQAVYDALAPIIADIDCPISVMPNAGYPHRLDDRTVYESAPSYFTRFARAFVELGASIVGGCCGTTPEHIAAMAPEVVGQKVRARTRHEHHGSGRALSRPGLRSPTERDATRPLTAFERKLGNRFVTTAEIAPPRGVDVSQTLAAARLFESVGVDAVHVADNPTARPSMSGTTAAHLIMRETNLATILHFSCRDRNLVGLQSELLGAAALGIPAIVALTGDPSNIGDFPKATSVFDVTALGLTRILRGLNDGHDQSGSDIGAPTRFRIGAAVNPVPRDLAAECARLDEKIAAGADFAVTQPVFQSASLAPFLERARAAGIAVLVGLLPLRSYENAEYLHNEVPGMRVPDEIRERMRKAGDEAREGIRIARDLLVELAEMPGVAGVYIVSQERYEAAAEVIQEGLRALAATA
jgi:methionine synthase / methylenetetrahydrofolate reductase (NADH)